MRGLWVISKPFGLIPGDEGAAAWIEKQADGKTVLMSSIEIRNPLFFRKYFAMMDRAFNYWCEHTQPIKFKGLKVEPDPDRFRHDVTVAAGFCHAEAGLDGSVRLVADSIAWSNMDEARFSSLYEATLTVLVQQIFTRERYPQMPESLLAAIVNDLLEFS